MGHRSWIKEIKTVTEFRNMLLFIGDAEEITGYGCSPRLEVLFIFDGVPYLGWASDGSTAGQFFRGKFPRGKFSVLDDLKIKGKHVSPKDLHDKGTFFTSRTLLKFFKQLKNPDEIDYKEIRKAANSAVGA